MHLQTVYPLRQEVCFLNASFTDRFRNTQSAFSVSSHASSFSILAAVRSPVRSDPGGQQFQHNDGELAAVILAECSLLGRVVVRVVANTLQISRAFARPCGIWNWEPSCAPLSDIHPGRRSQTRYPRCCCTVNTFTRYRIFRSFVVGAGRYSFSSFSACRA